MGGVALMFGHQLLSIYSSEADVIAFGYRRMQVFFVCYYLCGMQERALHLWQLAKKKNGADSGLLSKKIKQKKYVK